MLTYFKGLLNKERQILDTIGKDKPGKFIYKLFKRQQQRIVDPDDLVTSDNWLKILHGPHDSEQLDLWMEREIPEIAVTQGSDDESAKPRPPIYLTAANESSTCRQPGSQDNFLHIERDTSWSQRLRKLCGPLGN
jgi:hypothetical protein